MSSNIFSVGTVMHQSPLCHDDPFGVILKSLTFFGVFLDGYAPGGSVNGKLTVAYRYATLTYMHCVVLAHLYGVCSGITGWTDIITMFIAGSAVFTMDFLSLRSRSIKELLSTLRACTGDTSLAAHHRLSQRARLGVTAIWVYLVAFIVNSICSVSVSHPQDTWNTYFLGVNASHFSVSTARAAAIIVTSLRLYLVDGPWFFFMGLFVIICWVLQASFEDLGSKVADDCDLTPEDVGGLKRRYHHLTTVVNDVNDNFSPSLFAWYVTVLVALCSRFSAIVTRTSTETNLVFWWVTHLLGLLWTLAIMFGVSIAAAEVNESPTKILASVEAAGFRTADKRNDLAKMCMSVQLWVLGMRHHCARLTGWNFFTISRPFILSLIGVIVTYTVIIIQMNPELMMKLQKGI
ncbi:uncharacterized protein LOC135395200 [Ornithodoros turicata]|uniref:uncharacterized protein LOC135395200 n=1 Tax=Ornithodoros turicata TaxID=34597 RepID=UPI00313935DF